MKLPNAAHVIVGYLLNRAHPDNGGKAKFFEGLGFRSDQWEQMAQAFRVVARCRSDQLRDIGTRNKIVVVARIETPSGSAALVRTIWMVERGMDTPRLVTAYPQRR